MLHPHIGIFDSGVGGLSVWKEINRLLPEVSMTYVADQAWCPYGGKPQQEIQARCEYITQFLLSVGCELIVVACNTATAHAIQYLRKTFPLPFVGMEPAIKPAAEQTQTGHIGVLATEGTFRGDHFSQTRSQHASNVVTHVKVGQGLVELVEQGQYYGEEVEAVLSSLLTPMLEAGVDQLVLGCTHYPFLIPALQRVINNKATLINPAPAVARQVKRMLQAAPNAHLAPQKPREPSFYTSGSLPFFQQQIQQLLSLSMPVAALPPPTGNHTVPLR